MPETNVERARRGFAAVARGDLDAIRDLLDPDVKWHGGDATAPYACHNRDDALAFIAQARRRGPVGELVDVVEAGDRLVVIMRAGPDLRANLVTFREGRVVEMVSYESPAAALAAV